MKRYLLYGIVIFLTYSCAPVMSTAEVKKISENSNGLLKLKVVGYGKTKLKAIEEGKMQAFKMLLFYGIPSSSLSKGIAGNESELKEKHKDYFKKLLEQKGAYSFITNFKETSDYSKKEDKIECVIEINVKSLKADLEQNNVIRRFGL